MATLTEESGFPAGGVVGFSLTFASLESLMTAAGDSWEAETGGVPSEASFLLGSGGATLEIMTGVVDSVRGRAAVSSIDPRVIRVGSARIVDAS